MESCAEVSPTYLSRCIFGFGHADQGSEVLWSKLAQQLLHSISSITEASELALCVVGLSSLHYEIDLQEIATALVEATIHVVNDFTPTEPSHCIEAFSYLPRKFMQCGLRIGLKFDLTDYEERLLFLLLLLLL